MNAPVMVELHGETDPLEVSAGVRVQGDVVACEHLPGTTCLPACDSCVPSICHRSCSVCQSLGE